MIPIAIGLISQIPSAKGDNHQGVLTAPKGMCWPYSSGWKPKDRVATLAINLIIGDKCAVNPAWSKSHQRDYCHRNRWGYHNTGFFSTKANWCSVDTRQDYELGK